MHHLALQGYLLNSNPSSLIDKLLEHPLAEYLSYPLESDEINYQPEEVIELFNQATKNFLTDSKLFDNQNEMARCLTLILFHLDAGIEAAEIFYLPFLQLFRQELQKLSEEILRIYYEEGEYANEKMVKKYKFLRKHLSRYNFNLDGDRVPLVDPIFQRHSDLVLLDNPAYQSNPDLLLDKRPAKYNEDKDFLSYLLFEE